MSGLYSSCGFLGLSPNEVPCSSIRDVDDLDNLNLKADCNWFGFGANSAEIEDISDECNVICQMQDSTPGIVRGGKCVTAEEANIGTTTADLQAVRNITINTRTSNNNTTVTEAPLQCTQNLTYKQNDECVQVTQCDQDSYESRAPTLTSDRVCKNVTQCNWPTEYESKAPTIKSDRRCTPVRPECDYEIEYESQTPSRTQNRICTPLTICDTINTNTNPTQFVQVEKTKTSDRICGDLTRCLPDEFQKELPTHTKDRVCADLKDCERDEIPECHYETDQEPIHDNTIGMYISDRTCKLKYGVPALWQFSRNPDTGICEKSCGGGKQYFRGYCRGEGDDCSDYATNKTFQINKIDGVKKEPIGNWTVLEDCPQEGCVPREERDPRHQPGVCTNDCSGHGVCANNTCECDAGFRGEDCSNSTADHSKRKLTCQFMGIATIDDLQRKTADQTVDNEVATNNSSYVYNIEKACKRNEGTWDETNNTCNPPFIDILTQKYNDNKQQLENANKIIPNFVIAEPGETCNHITEEQCEVYAQLNNLQYLGEINQLGNFAGTTNENGCVVRSLGYRDPPEVEFMGINGKSFGMSSIINLDRPDQAILKDNYPNFDENKCSTQSQLTCVCGPAS